MKTSPPDATQQAKDRMVDMAGRLTQDMGLGRVFGQITMFLYLSEREQPLDSICDGLGLSKAAVSTMARQLETWGLIQRSWVKGDRRAYYQSAENIAKAIRQGVSVFLGQKVSAVSDELSSVEQLLSVTSEDDTEDTKGDFVLKRVQRTRSLVAKAERMMGNPLIKVLGLRGDGK
jgi:DNA-binding transcriptional regulator GbsR (MarR family)